MLKHITIIHIVIITMVFLIVGIHPIEQFPWYILGYFISIMIDVLHIIPDSHYLKKCPYFGDRYYKQGCKGCKEFGVMDQCGDEIWYEE